MILIPTPTQKRHQKGSPENEIGLGLTYRGGREKGDAVPGTGAATGTGTRYLVAGTLVPQVLLVSSVRTPVPLSRVSRALMAGGRGHGKQAHPRQ